MEEEKNDFEEVYDDDARETLVENDQISPEEEAFMSGYEEQKEKIKRNLEGDDAYERAFQEKQEKTKRKKQASSKKKRNFKENTNLYRKQKKKKT